MTATLPTQTPSPARKSSAGKVIAGVVAGVIAAAGITAGVALAVNHPVDPAGSSSTGTNGHHNGPVAPSQEIMKLQSELGQLNYYEGPVNGYLNQATTQAITYLQRDAGLPQTGTMNQATHAALEQMLATGNNNMNN